MKRIIHWLGRKFLSFMSPDRRSDNCHVNVFYNENSLSPLPLKTTKERACIFLTSDRQLCLALRPRPRRFPGSLTSEIDPAAAEPQHSKPSICQTVPSPSSHIFLSPAPMGSPAAHAFIIRKTSKSAIRLMKRKKIEVCAQKFHDHIPCSFPQSKHDRRERYKQLTENPLDIRAVSYRRSIALRASGLSGELLQAT